MKLEDFDKNDILLCEIIVADGRGRMHHKKMVYSKAGGKDDIKHILNKMKIKTAKSIEIIPMKKIGHRNAQCS